jgi:hypothetical protein
VKFVEIVFVVGSLILAAKSDTFRGHISAVAEKQIVVAAQGEQRPFDVTAETKITLDGQDVKLEQLPVGASAEVTAERNDKGMKATAIVAISLKQSSH